MGQLVGVVEKKSAIPGIVRFELNRNLSGCGHEQFGSVADAVGPHPSAELARRLFATEMVTAVHVYMNIVTVELKDRATSAGMSAIVRDLYQFWKPGMAPPTFEDLQPADEAASAAPGAAVAEGGGGAGLDPRVPALLWERSQAAMAKWKANKGG